MAKTNTAVQLGNAVTQLNTYTYFTVCLMVSSYYGTGQLDTRSIHKTSNRGQDGISSGPCRIIVGP